MKYSSLQVLYRSILNSPRIKGKTEYADIIKKVVRKSAKLYENETLKNGQPYLCKPLSIAQICVEELGLSYPSVCAVLLYHAVEEHKIDIDQFKLDIGEKAIGIIKGRLRISSLQNDKAYIQSEQFSKLFITLCEDIRVVLTKLADLLYSLRNASMYDVDLQHKLALDATILYAPLAHRLGLYKIKLEMEDLSLKISKPNEYEQIETKLEETRKAREIYVNNFIIPIEENLKTSGINFEIKYRTKSVNSIYQKMLKQKVNFEGVYDVFAVRIIIDCTPEEEKALCWKVYSSITDKYMPNPSRLRDWISIPKSTGYESLHTTVMGPEGKWVEIQIRSKRMDEIAEKGIAAHWKYKGIKANRSTDDYLGQIRELLETISNTQGDIVNQFIMEVKSDEIFVFTPKGDLKSMKKGSTVLDFAFEIHTQVGAKCIGAKVNGKTVKFKHIIENGDQVEIITAKNQKPNNDWLNIVTTTKAKAIIRKLLIEEKLKEAEIGKENFDRKFKNWKIEIDKHLINRILSHFKLKTANDFYYLIGTEKIDLQDVKEFIQLNQSLEDIESKDILNSPKFKISEKSSSNLLTIEDSLKNINYHFASCCNPIKGDPIAGFVSIGKGITIHRTNCKNFIQLAQKFPYRIQEAAWKVSIDDKSFIATLKVIGNDQVGILNNISEVISSDLKINMQSLTVNSRGGMFEGIFKIIVNDTQMMENLVHRIKRVKGVLKVNRVNN